MKLFGKEMFPHVMQKAAISMHSIINFHPFVDGNKRMALLSTNYYLLWNGYTLNIPFDADVALIGFAKNQSNPNVILNWIKANTKRTVSNVIKHWQCETLAINDKVPASMVFVDKTLLSIFLPREGLQYFKNKILQDQTRKR